MNASASAAPVHRTGGIKEYVKRHPIVLEVAARLLCAVGVPALARRRRHGLAILMYHGVEAEPLSPACSHVLDASSLRRQLRYLRMHYNVLPLDEALERLAAGTLPDRAVALTFDDGTRNLATNAVPVLRSLGLPAAIFVATGPMGTGETLWPDRLWLAFARTTAPYVDLTPVGLGTRPLGSAEDRGEAYAAAVERFKDLPDEERMARLESLITALGVEFDDDPGPFRLLSWDEARSVASDGLVALYPHSVTHPILARCSDEKVDREVSDSCAAVERETGIAPTVFAYPNGQPEDFDERAMAALRRRGVRWALSTSRGRAHSGSDPLALPRIASNSSFALFRLQVSGALP